MGREQTMARQIELKWEVVLGKGKGERGREEKETEREREEETGKALFLQRNSGKETSGMGRGCLLKEPLHLCSDVAAIGPWAG